MNIIKRIVCFLDNHDWAMPDGSFPTHGYDDIPYKGAFCTRCGVKA